MNGEHRDGLVQSLSGSSLLVTGGSPLARRIAPAARDRGAQVTVASPDASVQCQGAGVASIHAMLDSEPGVDRLFADLTDRMPPIDTLVAVIPIEPLPALHEVALDDWRRCVTSPLRTSFWLARRAIDEFLAAGQGGRLVFVTDCSPADSADARNEIVEHALVSLVRSIAREYGRRRLACNAVLPVPPCGGSATGHEALRSIVEQVLFLVSRDAAFITGEAIRPRLLGSPAERASNISASRKTE